MSGQRVAERWTDADAGDQSGRIAVVTGSNSGIGFEAARMLAAHGATVVLACRDLAKADQAAARIAAGAPSPSPGPGEPGAVATVRLDLASLASVREAAAQLTERYPRLDLLIDNAGVMTPPYGRTEDGFEMQIGTNHLGHFAFTGLVLGLLLEVPGSRVVTVSSQGHRAGRINFDDLQFEHGYSRFRAYGQSKLANLLFTSELQRRLSAAGSTVLATAAHPGYAATNLQFHSGHRAFDLLSGVGNRLLAQDENGGALPTLYAALEDIPGDSYAGPGGFMEQRGAAKLVGRSAAAKDTEVARRLWDASEELTATRLPLATRTNA
jgi:NAD(P)-dependent dehydrogenase (short-subunit alcohol dehydrogenase family)